MEQLGKDLGIDLFFKALMAGLIRWMTTWQIMPGGTRPQDPQHTVEDLPVVRVVDGTLPLARRGG